VDSEHSYATSALGWPLQIRPTYFYYESYPTGLTESITSLGNPILWWVMAITMIIALVLLFRQGSYPAFIMSFGLICGWIPWIYTAERTQFAFYAIIIEPFLILGLVTTIAWLSRIKPRATLIGTSIFTIIIIGLTFYFWPIWTGEIIDSDYLYDHFWIPSWI
jgi:dolichyl-phosphate-mannose--protein O-mannosyl transferase